MKIQWVSNSYGQSGFAVERVEYDAVFPVTGLWVNTAPAKMNPERVAIAAYLAFGEFASGEFQLHQKFGPATAGAMVEDSKPTQIFPQPIEYYPKALPLGLHTCAVTFSMEERATFAPHADTAITVLNSDSWNGAMTSHRSLLVSSNGFLIDALHRGGIRARLAVAVLFAEDLNVDVFLVSAELVPDQEEQKALEDLLLACRLGIQFI